jgi:hypothetical protein
MISPEEFAARLASEPPEQEWRAEWSKEVADEMRMNVAVDTGFTRSTIEVTPEGVVAGGAIVFLEYGTSKMAPQPVAVPAVNRFADPAARDAGDRVIRQLT